MKEFLKIESDGLLSQGIAIDDSNCLDADGVFSVDVGAKYCQNLLGGNWVCFNPKENPFFIASLGMYYINKRFCKNKDGTNVISKTPIFLNLPNNTSYVVFLRNASSLFIDLLSKVYFDSIHRSKLPYSDTPIGETHAIIRDPIQRFASAYALNLFGANTKMTQDEFVDWVVSQKPESLDRHFKPQTTTIGDTSGVLYHDFSKDLNPLATIFGLPTPLSIVNSTDSIKKPVLTNDQIAKLQNYYAADVELYNKVSST